MKLTRYASAAEFLAHARRPLEKEEAANNLIVGIAARVAESPDYYKHPIYLATVDAGPDFIAAGVRTPPFNVIVSSVRGADPEPLRLILDDLLDFAGQFPPDSPAGRLPGITAHSDIARAFSEVWSERTGKPYMLAMSQRIYELQAGHRPRGRARSSTAG